MVFTLYRELSHIDFKNTVTVFSKINRWMLVGLFACGGASLLLLSMYDVILVKSLKMEMPLFKIIRISYIINAFNAIIGFGGFIGAGVRAVVYKIIRKTRKISTLYFNHLNLYAHRIKLIIYLGCVTCI